MWRAWSAVGVILVGAASLCVAGCAGSGPGTDLTTPQGAVERWARSLETANSEGYTEVLAPDYRYDGTEGGSGDALAPGVFGAGGNVVVEVLDVVESGDSAVARVRIQYTGFLSDIFRGGTGGGGQTDPDDGWDGPGFGPPKAPSGDGGTEVEAPEESSPALLREVRGEQIDATPVSFTAIVVLGLRYLDGAWMVVSQRQESSILLVGNGAEAPVITSLTGNGVERPQVAPRADIEVRATVEGASGSSLFTRIGYIQRTLQLDGEVVTGVIRAPRIPGEYVLEVYAERVSPVGAYGIATRGIEAEVLDDPAVGFSFTVADGVGADPAAASTVRGLLEALHAGQDTTPFFDPGYDYDGQSAESAAWNVDLPFVGYGDSDIAATITAAEPIAGGQALTVELAMEIDDFDYGYGPVYDEAPTSEPGAPGGEDGKELMPQPYGAVHSDATYRVEVASAGGLIAAMRALEVVETRGDSSLPIMADLLVNGSEAPALVGAERFTVTGTSSGSHAWVQVSPDQVREYVGDGAFSAELRAPFTRGRWLLRAEAWSWGAAGSARVLRTMEITVTEDAPTPEVSVAAGVGLSSAERTTLNTWLGGLYLGRVQSLDAAYSPSYDFDGLTKGDVLTPRIRAYHADFSRAEATAASRAGGTTRVAVALEFFGPMQYFADNRPIERPDPPLTGVAAPTAPGYEQASTVLDVVLELGADGRITAEWIRAGTSRWAGASVLSLGPVTVSGGTGPLSAGEEVEVRADPTAGTVDYAVVRLGSAAEWQEEPAAVIGAPEAPGRYVAEVVAQSGMPVVDYVDGGDEGAAPPEDPGTGWTGVCAISAVEVLVK